MSTTPIDPFVNWLSTGTTRREVATLFGDQAGIAEVTPLWGERDALRARLSEIEDDAPTRQRVLGERSERSSIEAEIAKLDEVIEPLEERIEASRSVWTVRPLRSDEIDAIDEANPAPVMPVPTEEQKTTEKGKTRFQGIWDEYLKAKAKVNVDRLFEQLSAAIVSVEMPAATLDSVSVEHLRAMDKAEYGAQRIKILSDALNRAMTLEEEPGRPFSSSASESTPE